MTLPDLGMVDGVDPDAVLTASAAVRDFCGWHVAPAITQTVTLDSTGASVLCLPSLLVTDVASVVVLGQVMQPDAYQWSQDGYLEGCWPRRLRSVVVTFTHGYDACPLPVLQAIRRLATVGKSAGIRSQTTGPYSVTYEAGALSGGVDGAIASLLGPYALPKRP